MISTENYILNWFKSWCTDVSCHSYVPRHLVSVEIIMYFKCNAKSLMNNSDSGGTHLDVGISIKNFPQIILYCQVFLSYLMCFIIHIVIIPVIL